MAEETKQVKYLKDKPEVDSFSHAYVEAADGSLVRVAKDKMKKALGIGEYFDTEVYLRTDAWVAAVNETHFTQELAIEGITANSRVDLNPTPEQMVQLIMDEVSLFVCNEDGVVTIYSVNAIPSKHMTISVRVTEVL